MNETSGHHLVVLTLPLSAEELLTRRAAVVSAASVVWDVRELSLFSV